MPLTTTVLDSLTACMSEAGLGEPMHTTTVGGGDICHSLQVNCSNGQQVFAKLHHNAPPRFFAAEAMGLSAMAKATPLRVPEVLAYSDQCLLLEDLGQGQPGPAYWPLLAEGLAIMHQDTQSCFGFTLDNYCGTSSQPNPHYNDGYQFFSEQRLGHQIKMAADTHLLDAPDNQALNKLIQRLPELIPEQAPVLLHGDLWSGNIHCDSTSHPCLVDPACYWGWREADIAMSSLFGGVPESFYQHYQSILPMEPGWQQRLPLYNLYHLLNHLNLFGQSYLAPIRQLLNRFN